MTNQDPNGGKTKSTPEVALMQMATGEVVSQLIVVAAKLGIADLLADGPKSSDELARAVNVHPEALYRVLRALASLGIFAERPDGQFELTPLAEPLQTEVPTSVRARVSWAGEKWWWQVWGDLLYSVRTNKTAFDEVHGMPLFDYFRQNPETAEAFSSGMAQITGIQATAVVDAYDFTGINTLADIGGGEGILISTILKAHQNIQGMLVELPVMLEGARRVLGEKELLDRCELIEGDFFKAIPSGADAYVLKDIIHDWDDESALTILKNCRKALTSNGRLLVVDRVIVPGNTPAFGKIVDIMMLALTGGRERTEEEFVKLLNEADFKITQVISTQSDTSVIEAIPT